MNITTTLDGTEVTIPEGIRDLSQELFYDDELKGIFYRVDNNLTFTGDGYDYLEDIVFNQSICSQIEFVLNMANEGSYEIFKGIIHIADFTELNPERETIKTPIADNNVSSYIFNNQNIKAYVDAPVSKNGVAITAITITNIKFFTPSTCNYNTNIKCCSVFECFKMLVSFMSDNTMTFSSPLFGTGGEHEFTYLITGENIREQYQHGIDAEKYPYISFADLFSEMNKLFNISFKITYGDIPELIIDKTENLYSETELMTFSNVKDPIVKLEKQSFYSKIQIGSQKTQEQDGIYTMGDGRFIGFKEEEYHTLGQCNIDRTLNLVNNYIIDSNVIEDVIVNFNDTYDKDVFIIEALDDVNTMTYPLTGGACVYNLAFSNYNKSVNYLGAIPNDIAAYISDADNRFQATEGAYDLPSGVIIHSTEVSDPANNYDDVTGIMTCQVSKDGAYSFTFGYTGLSYTVPTGTALGTSLGQVYLRHYNAGSVFIEEILLHEYLYSPIFIFLGVSYTGVLTLAAGDYVTLEGNAALGTVTFTNGSTYTGDYVDVEGGTFQTYDPNDYHVMSIEFNAPLTQTEFDNIKDNIDNKVTVQSGKSIFKGWIKNISRNIMTGISKIIIRTSNSARN